MFAGLLKVMQASIPGGSAGALILASRNFGWGLEPGVLLGMTTAAAGLVLVSAALRRAQRKYSSRTSRTRNNGPTCSVVRLAGLPRQAAAGRRPVGAPVGPGRGAGHLCRLHGPHDGAGQGPRAACRPGGV